MNNKFIVYLKSYSYLFIFLFIWMVLLAFVGFNHLTTIIADEWDISLTMLFASFIAGSTSLGGGAVAFPMLTKIQALPPHTAMLFGIAIQSIGMTAAAILIFSRHIKVEYRLIFIALIGSCIGFTISYFMLRPFLSPSVIKYLFTTFSILVAFSLIINTHKNILFEESDQKKNINTRLLLLVGMIGGGITGFIGTGADFVFFTLLSLLYGKDIKVSTASSVVLMALTSVYASILLLFTTDVFTPEITSMWLAAIPFVIVGAPLGAYFCQLVSEVVVIRMVFVLVFIESMSTFLLVPVNSVILLTMLMVSIVYLFFVVNVNFTKLKKIKISSWWQK